MIRCSRNGVVFYRFESLDSPAGLVHGIFTRIGGASTGPFATLNVGHSVGDDPNAVKANHERVFHALGLPLEQCVTAHQVHAARVAWVGTKERGTIMLSTDALITCEPGVPLLLRFADCVPVLLHAPSRHAIGLVHAGWRGVVAGVVPATLAAMQRAFDCDSREVFAALGPAIGPCCYEVGADLADQVVRAVGRDDLLRRQPQAPEFSYHDRSASGLYLDLPGAVRCQLESAGVRSVETSALCTSCHRDEFFSHRAEGGHTGRFAAVLALR